ncbi:hypothetical protein K8638_21650 [Myxococcus sp. RHST-1-4]|nr:hypothetical protein [Myxococcus sp. RHSTA-1-4]
MKPLPVEGPLVWMYERDHDVLAHVSRADFERRMGPPHGRDLEGDGLGPTDWWAWRADCGLTVAVLYRERTGRFHVFTGEEEIDHALAHLAWWSREVEWRADEGRPLAKNGWAVYRQDDTGNRHDVTVMPVRSHAECLARLLEARAHKQWYAVEARGTPPPQWSARPREGWAVIRQDEHGNRAEVLVHPSEEVARKLAAAYGSEPRHKQTYFVVPVAPGV